MALVETIAALSAYCLIVGAPRALAAPRVTRLLLTILVVAGTLLAAIGPLRWQLVPLLLLVVVGAAFGLRRLRRGTRPRPWWVRAGGAVVAGLAVLVAAIPLVLFPLFDLPAPRGKIPVGVQDIALRDPSRADPLFGGARAVMIRAWYPARATPNALPAPYVSRRFARALLDPANPVVILNHLSLVGTSGRLGLPVAAGRHPVVVFVPGYQSFNAQSTALAQDLASNGYVVLALGLPGDAMAVDFPGGPVRTFRRFAFLDQLGRALPLQKAMEQDVSPARMAELARAVKRAVPESQRALDLWTADVGATLDKIDAGGLGPLDGHLDAARIAVVGMSFGGATAGLTCHRDARCRAGVNLDGFQFGDLEGREIGKPFLIVANGLFKRSFTNDTSGRARIRPPGAPALVNLQVRGSRHGDFSDLALASPFAKRWLRNSAVGPIDGHRMIALTSDVVQGFLDEQMLGQAGKLGQATARWPEVIVRRPPLPPGWG